MTTAEDSWYIVKKSGEKHCEIITEQAFQLIDAATESAPNQQPLEKWGPFKAQNQAIAKRVGLIRSGKCQPQ